MHVEQMTVGMFQSNCFIASCDETKEAVVIDAGDEGDRIVGYVEENDLDVKMIVNTHAHIDHVSGLPAVVAALRVSVVMHRSEMLIYDSLDEQAGMFGLKGPGSVKIERFIDEGDLVIFGKSKGKVLHTPGHSPGGITIVFEEENPKVAFVGDVLFQGSIGRTDLSGADHDVMMNTLENVIMKLPDDMIVYSGHGPPTTIGREKQSNPFLTQFG